MIPPRPPHGIPKSIRPYLRATLTACDVEEWQRVMRVALKDATEGNDKVRGPAREFLRKAIFGETPAVQVLNLLAQEGSAIAVNVGGSGDPTELLGLLSDIVGFLAGSAADESRKCA
jgi:hypothetical protein